MDTEHYDLLIIGGGINGAGIARDAAGRGLKVLLVEQGDLASATSSASTKLIHGGLRYLEYYEFRLVAEALAEREVLLRANAPCRRWWPGNEDTVPGVTREQAHVPAEQPPSRQDTWLPAAHADQGRARGPRRPAAQGPGPGQRLTGRAWCRRGGHRCFPQNPG